MSRESLKNTDYVRRAFRYAGSDMGRQLLSAALWSAPIVVLELWALFDPFIYGETAKLVEQDGEISPASGALAVATSIIAMLCLTGFAIDRHRFVLREVAPLRQSFAAAILPYVGACALLSLGVMLAYVGLLFAGSACAASAADMVFIVPGAIAATGLLSLILLRGCLIFPAIATGGEMGLRQSFRLTKGSFWRMVIAAVLLALPFVALNYAWAAILLGAISPFELTFAPQNASGAIYTVGAVLTEFRATTAFVAYISLHYAHFTGLDIPSGGAASQPTRPAAPLSA